MAEALSRFSAMIALVIYYYRLQIEDKRRLWLQRRSQRQRCTICQAFRISSPKLVTMKVTISSLARSQCQSFPRVSQIIPSSSSRVSSHPVQNWLPRTAIVSILIVLYFFSIDSMRSFLMARISSLCSPTSSAISRSKFTALISAASLVLSISFLVRRASSCSSSTSAITLSYNFHSSSNLLLNFSSNSRKRCQSGRSTAICLLCCVFPCEPISLCGCLLGEALSLSNSFNLRIFS